jgi:imidazolonepropionase-like amidohydrolase
MRDDFAGWFRETAALDLADPRIEAILRAAAWRRVVLTPTAVADEMAWNGGLGEHRLEEQERFYTPAAWRAVENYRKGPAPPRYPADIQVRVREKDLEFIRRAHDAGCLLGTGTDYVLLTVLPGWSLWREIEIFAEAGLPPMEILKAATWDAAYALGRTDQLGGVEPGKLADFVVLVANPLESISNARSVHRVVKGGVIYDWEALLEPLVGVVD